MLSYKGGKPSWNIMTWTHCCLALNIILNQVKYIWPTLHYATLLWIHPIFQLSIILKRKTTFPKWSWLGKKTKTPPEHVKTMHHADTLTHAHTNTPQSCCTFQAYAAPLTQHEISNTHNTFTWHYRWSALKLVPEYQLLRRVICFCECMNVCNNKAPQEFQHSFQMSSLWWTPLYLWPLNLEY